MKTHLRTSNVDSVFFSIYRDDALDILKNGKVDHPALRQELDSLHPNVKWDVTCEKEGGYLDLFIMIKNGRIEWKIYIKTPPLYLSKISCHDPQIFKGIPRAPDVCQTWEKSSAQLYTPRSLNIQFLGRMTSVSHPTLQENRGKGRRLSHQVEGRKAPTAQPTCRSEVPPPKTPVKGR